MRVGLPQRVIALRLGKSADRRALGYHDVLRPLSHLTIRRSVVNVPGLRFLMSLVSQWHGPTSRKSGANA
jgi:hypothetical protein